jgi:hypothetical protein
MQYIHRKSNISFVNLNRFLQTSKEIRKNCKKTCQKNDLFLLDFRAKTRSPQALHHRTSINQKRLALHRPVPIYTVNALVETSGVAKRGVKGLPL